MWGEFIVRQVESSNMKRTTIRELLLMTTIIALIIPYLLPYFANVKTKIPLRVSQTEIESWVQTADPTFKPVRFTIAIVAPHGQRQGQHIDLTFSSTLESMDQISRRFSACMRSELAKTGLTIKREWGDASFYSLLLQGGRSEHCITIRFTELTRDGEKGGTYCVSCLTDSDN